MQDRTLSQCLVSSVTNANQIQKVSNIIHKIKMFCGIIFELKTKIIYLKRLGVLNYTNYSINSSKKPLMETTLSFTFRITVSHVNLAQHITNLAFIKMTL